MPRFFILVVRTLVTPSSPGSLTVSQPLAPVTSPSHCSGFQVGFKLSILLAQFPHFSPDYGLCSSVPATLPSSTVLKVIKPLLHPTPEHSTPIPPPHPKALLFFFFWQLHLLWGKALPDPETSSLDTHLSHESLIPQQPDGTSPKYTTKREFHLVRHMMPLGSFWTQNYGVTMKTQWQYKAKPSYICFPVLFHMY